MVYHQYWEADEILDVRVLQPGRTQYLVLWKGYGSLKQQLGA